MDVPSYNKCHLSHNSWDGINRVYSMWCNGNTATSFELSEPGKTAEYTDMSTPANSNVGEVHCTAKHGDYILCSKNFKSDLTFKQQSSELFSFKSGTKDCSTTDNGAVRCGHHSAGSRQTLFKIPCKE